MNYSELKNLCDSRKMLVSDLICHIGMTYQGLKAGLESGKIGSDKVLAICKTLKISPNAFYGWEMIQPLNESDTASQVSALELLKQQLQIKDKQIAELHELLKK